MSPSLGFFCGNNTFFRHLYLQKQVSSYVCILSYSSLSVNTLEKCLKLVKLAIFCYINGMIYCLSGSLAARKAGFVIVDVGGINYKVFVSPMTLEKMPISGQPVRLYTYLNVKENALDLFGFLREVELNFFEKLISINGIGPRSALGLMAVAPVEQLAAAINEGKAELLTRAAGVGKKTAERVVLELRGKLAVIGTEDTVRMMESDVELEEVLISLGYNKMEARTAISKISDEAKTIEAKLKEVLRLIKS